MDYQGIRDAIAQELASDIGICTLPDGLTVPAIRLEVGGQGQLPAGSKGEGLEVIVVAAPNYTLVPIVGGWQKTTRALVVLKMWDKERSLLGQYGDGPLDRVINVLGTLDLDIDPNISGVPVFEQLGNIETATVRVSTMVSHA